MSTPPFSAAIPSCLLAAAIAVTGWTHSTLAQDPAPAAPSVEKAAEPDAKASGPRKQKIENWGVALDLEGDCEFKAEGGKLSIIVPGTPKPHDMSTEMLSCTAPRVLQPARGDFTLQVKIDGEFAPGDESTQPGRTGYTGAGLIVFADEKNYVRLERATLHGSGGSATPYTNFEIRVGGELQRIGTTADLPTEAGKPTWLRIQRKGNLLFGAMSQDGVTWKEGEPKDLLSPAWRGDVLAGVAAISTSKTAFQPTYSEFSVKTNWTDAKETEATQPEEKKK